MVAMTEQHQHQSSSHVRSKIRKQQSPTVPYKSDEEGEREANDDDMEQARHKVNSWIGTTNIQETSSVDKLLSKKPVEGKEGSSSAPLKGILREKSKYYNKAASPKTTDSSDSHHAKEKDGTDAFLRPAAVKDVVVERRIAGPRDSGFRRNGLDSIDGYTPGTVKERGVTIGSSNASSEEPLVLSSMAELLAHSTASNEPAVHNSIVENTKDEELPSQPTVNDTQPTAIETDLSFSVMAPNEYQEALDEEQQQASNLYNVFYDRQHEDQQQHDDDEHPDTMGVDGEEEPRHDEDNNDDEVLYILEQEIRREQQENGDDAGFDLCDVGDALPPPEPRAFMRLWTALSEWITPQATDWVLVVDKTLRHVPPPVVDSSDVGASRCAGLHSILKRNLPRIYKELEIPQEERRSVELHLSHLLRCFSYSQPNPNLGSKLWRTMTAVLVTLAVQQDAEQQSVSIPPCAKEVGMKHDEYRYLCRSALTSLGSNTTSVGE